MHIYIYIYIYILFIKPSKDPSLSDFLFQANTKLIFGGKYKKFYLDLETFLGGIFLFECASLLHYKPLAMIIGDETSLLVATNKTTIMLFFLKTDVDTKPI